MQFKRLILSFILLLGLGQIVSQTQTLYIRQTNGTQTACDLSNIQKMSFSSGNIIANKTDYSNGVSNLNELRYLKFSGITVDIEGPVRILSIEGKTILTRKVSNARILSLNISHLSRGFYFCSYSNANEIAAVKTIK